MNYNTDGFNERNIYIMNSNDANALNGKTNNLDNSFAKMKVEEHKSDVETVNRDKTFIQEEIRGIKENFVVRNARMNFVNKKDNNNSLNNAFNKNLFRK